MSKKTSIFYRNADTSFILNLTLLVIFL